MFKNIPKEKILEVVRQGPTLPQKIVKQVGGDTMIVGAILSTLIHSKEVKYSSLKVGGSPVYYVSEDEEKLEEFTNYLNEKDQKTVKMLKDQKVMQDSAQNPLTRVSLKTIKDFSRSFESEHNGKKELFYRYFLVPIGEAELLASEILKKQEQLLKEEEKKVEETKTEVVEEVQSAIKEPEIKKAEEKPEEIREVPKEMVVEEKPPEEKSIHKSKHHGKRSLFEKISDKIIDMGLDLISKEKVKRTEYNLVLKNHDSNEYFYSVVKDKKTINEGDLATAFVFAHNKRMPCIFFITGTLTKKAKSMIDREFKDMKIEKL
jgi:hypothetical protein